MVRAAFPPPPPDSLQPASATAPDSPASCMNRRRSMPLLTGTSCVGSRSGDRLEGAGSRDLRVGRVGDDLQLERPGLARPPLASDQRCPGDVGEVGPPAGPVD